MPAELVGKFKSSDVSGELLWRLKLGNLKRLFLPLEVEQGH
jgi:hypothetical protein